jgi:tetratricopeptide (TPR) repeat protein
LALADAQRAIDLSPNFALGHNALGWVRIFLGRFTEALDALHMAMRLSPHDPVAYLFLSRIALAHYHLGNYEEAVHFSERALASRRLHFVLIGLLASLGQLGRTPEANAILPEIAATEPSDTAGYWRAIYPYDEPAHRDHLVAGLRKGGLE